MGEIVNYKSIYEKLRKKSLESYDKEKTMFDKLTEWMQQDQLRGGIDISTIY